MSLKSGDKVRVIGGPYRGWEGEILRFEEDVQRVTVLVPVFAKITAIDLLPSEIEPVR